MCTFANQIKTINLFKYEKMQVNIVYLNKAHQTIVRILMHARATS